jgi:hypothetical protein
MSCPKWKEGTCKGCSMETCSFFKKCHGRSCINGICGPRCYEYTFKEIILYGTVGGIIIFGFIMLVFK